VIVVACMIAIAGFARLGPDARFSPGVTACRI
jgi:hypothetical protein